MWLTVDPVGCSVPHLSWLAMMMSNNCHDLLYFFQLSPFILGWLLRVNHSFPPRISPSASRLIVVLFVRVCVLCGLSWPYPSVLRWNIPPFNRPSTCGQPRRWFCCRWSLNQRRRHRRRWRRHSWWCWWGMVAVGRQFGGCRSWPGWASSSVSPVTDVPCLSGWNLRHSCLNLIVASLTVVGNGSSSSSRASLNAWEGARCWQLGGGLGGLSLLLCGDGGAFEGLGGSRRFWSLFG